MLICTQVHKDLTLRKKHKIMDYRIEILEIIFENIFNHSSIYAI